MAKNKNKNGKFMNKDFLDIKVTLEEDEDNVASYVGVTKQNRVVRCYVKYDEDPNDSLKEVETIRSLVEPATQVRIMSNNKPGGFECQ